MMERQVLVVSTGGREGFCDGARHPQRGRFLRADAGRGEA